MEVETEHTSDEIWRLKACINDLVIVLDRQGRIVSFNRACEEVTGYSLAEVKEKSVWDLLLVPDEVELVKAVFAQLQAGQFPNVRENYWLAKDGTRRLIHWINRCLTDSLGAVEYVIGTGIEVTDRRRAEQAVQESEKRYRSLFENMLNGFVLGEIIYDDDGRPHDIRYLEVNPAFEGHTGIKAANIVGRTTRELFPGAEPVWFEQLGKAALGDEPVQFEAAFGPLNRVFDAYAFRAAPGRFGLVFNDVTRRKRAEEALRQSEEKYRSIVETATEAIVILDAQARIVFVNDRWSEMFGYSREEALHMTHFDLVFPEDVATLEKRWESRKEGRKETYELRLRRKDGNPVWVLVSVAPTFGPEGEFLGTLTMLADITERKVTEHALQERMKELACLYAVSRDFQEDLSVEELCQRAVEHLVPAMQFPEITVPVIEINGERFALENYTPGLSFGLQAEIRVEGQVLGHLRVYYAEEKPFLIPEEQNLVNGIAEALGAWLERERAEKALRASEERFHKRAEEELRRGEAYLAEAQRLSRTGSWAFDLASDKYVYLSEECFRIFGLDPQEGLPNREAVSRLIHPEDWDRVKADFEKALREKVDTSSEFRIALPDGRMKHIYTIRRPVLNGAGDVFELVGTAIDITERKHAEEALRDSEERLRLAVSAAELGVFELDVSSDTPRWENERMFEISGRTHAEGPLSHQAFYAEVLEPEDRPAYDQAFTAAMRTGHPFKLACRVRRCNDGQQIWIEYSGRFDLATDGSPKRLVGVIADITERKAAEDEIKALKDLLYKENLALRDEVDRASMFEEIVGTSAPLQAVLARVAKVAPTDSTVLITGETGTGKELIARAIHKRSRRAGRAFVSVNCTALAPSLISSELFGHEKGAFTGATQRRLGRFELGDGGTIFLDEVGELPPETQIALLRVLQEREFERVGGAQSIHVDVRIIAATNRDLRAAAANGTFRLDLFYRLNVFPIEVPPLRERKDDILMLLEYFVKRYASRAGKNIRSIDKKTIELFQSYNWSGNIRELQNIVERSVILASGDVLSVDESWFFKEPFQPSPRVQASRPFGGEEREEREIIEAALAKSRGRVWGAEGAAAKLGIPPSTLDYRIKALKIRKSQFRFRSS